MAGTSVMLIAATWPARLRPSAPAARARGSATSARAGRRNRPAVLGRPASGSLHKSAAPRRERRNPEKIASLKVAVRWLRRDLRRTVPPWPSRTMRRRPPGSRIVSGYPRPCRPRDLRARRFGRHRQRSSRGPASVEGLRRLLARPDGDFKRRVTPRRVSARCACRRDVERHGRHAVVDLDLT